MRRITRDVGVSALRHLLERPERAYLAFDDAGAVDAVAAVFRHLDERFFVGVTANASARIVVNASVTLLLDAGWYWYELQSIRVRGTIRAAAPPGGAAETLGWFEVLPRIVIAWDYGQLREVDDDDAG